MYAKDMKQMKKRKESPGGRRGCLPIAPYSQFGVLHILSDDARVGSCKKSSMARLQKVAIFHYFYIYY